jgi:dipeptidyl aminopeptidase/acylaminoacyl peptidase
MRIPLRAIVLAILSVSSEMNAQRPLGRRLTPEDGLAYRAVGPVRISPDGKWIAVVVGRAKTAGEYYRFGLGEKQRSDIWLVSPDGREVVDITGGTRDHAGFWDPVWSPDSRFLAMLSTRGNDNVRVYLWDRTTRRLSRVTTNGIDVNASFKHESGAGSGAIAWLDATHVLANVLPAGRQPLQWNEHEYTNEVDAAGAATILRGSGVTVHVLSSGDTAAPKVNDSSAVTSIDVASGKASVLANIPWVRTRLANRTIVISPRGTTIALAVTMTPRRPRSNHPIIIEDVNPLRLGVISTSARGSGVKWVDGVRPIAGGMTHNIIAMRWAPNDTMLALVGIPSTAQAEPDVKTPRQAFVVSASRGVVRAVDAGRGTSGSRRVATDVDWTANGGLLVLTYVPTPTEIPFVAEDPVNAGTPPNAPGDTARQSWWTVDQTNWTLTSEAQKPSPQKVGGAAAVRETSLPRGARTLGTSTSGGYTVYQTPDTKVYVQRNGSREPVLLVAVNRALEVVEPFRYMEIRYKSTDGKDLTGVVTLPYGYVPGRRYPVVVDVYGGLYAVRLQDTVHTDARYSSGNTGELLAAHGYLVLEPSMPLSPMGMSSDPLLDLDRGVGPAIRAVADMGLGDPSRVGVTGVSYGGYSVYSLITQTKHFKAAVAINGVTDLVTIFGLFDHRYRYRDYEYAALLGPYVTESQQLRMGVPLWKDPARYTRNSPITHADRVDTPLLMIAGSVDGPFTLNTEEFFSALYRQGKRAELLQYVGEGHGVATPANVIDQWRRIFAWFDEYLRGKGSQTVK